MAAALVLVAVLSILGIVAGSVSTICGFLILRRYQARAPLERSQTGLKYRDRSSRSMMWCGVFFGVCGALVSGLSVGLGLYFAYGLGNDERTISTQTANHRPVGDEESVPTNRPRQPRPELRQNEIAGSVRKSSPPPNKPPIAIREEPGESPGRRPRFTLNRRNAELDDVSNDQEAIKSDVLAIVSWNIQTGGTATSSTSKRPKMVKRALERMLSGTYQLLAAQEIPNTASAELLQSMLPGSSEWSLAFADTLSRMDNGFWFRVDTLAVNNHQVLLIPGPKDSKGRFLIDPETAQHPPQWAHFAVDDFDFTIVSLHLTFEGGNAEASRDEFVLLLDVINDYFETEGHDPDLIICGDFNIPSDASGETAGGLTVDSILQDDGRFNEGNRAMHVLVDENTSRTPISKGGIPANNYDHFIMSQSCMTALIEARRLSTTVLTDDPDDPEEVRTSDHFPIVAFFRTKGDGIRRDGTAAIDNANKRIRLHSRLESSGDPLSSARFWSCLATSHIAAR